MTPVADVCGGPKCALAIDGGPSVRHRAFAPWPSLSEDEVEAASAVLRSGRLNYWTGDEGRAFEAEFATFANCSHAIAVANGTVALELALYALGIGPGDEVIVPSRTFVASASCVVMRGATPVFADVDPVSQNITASTIRAVLTVNTRAVIVVHLAGWPCDMDPILQLARENHLRVIEDCAQAHGARYKGQPVGCLGDAAAFSFCQDKIISTGGEGGMLTTNDHQVWERAWSFKDHGKSYNAAHRPHTSPEYRWLHESFGTNWRLTELQSAIGRRLLAKLPAQLESRRTNAAILNIGFGRLTSLRTTIPPAGIDHAYYKYYVFLRSGLLRGTWTRDRILQALCAEGIPCFSGSCSEIYLEKAFPVAMRPAHRFPTAARLGETSLMFLVHPTLGEQEMLDTVHAVEKVVQEATLATPVEP